MNIKSINSRLDSLDYIIESCQSEELKNHYISERIEIGEKKLAACDDMLAKVWNQEASGIITESDAMDMADVIELEKDVTMSRIYPWYEETALAAGFNLALNELAAFANSILGSILSTAIGKTLTVPMRKFITARLNRYPLLHEDVIEFKQFTSDHYDLQEAKDLGFNFKYADKWFERGITRVYVVVYRYKKSPVMGVAYSKDIKNILGHNNLLEPVIKDSSFNKHQDYYVAEMCSRLNISHPAIGRTLKGLKTDWGKKVKDLSKDIHESVEDALINGTYEKKIEIIMESVENDRLDEESAERYITELKRAVYHIN